MSDPHSLTPFHLTSSFGFALTTRVIVASSSPSPDRPRTRCITASVEADRACTTCSRCKGPPLDPVKLQCPGGAARHVRRFRVSAGLAVNRRERRRLLLQAGPAPDRVSATKHSRYLPPQLPKASSVKMGVGLSQHRAATSSSSRLSAPSLVLYACVMVGPCTQCPSSPLTVHPSSRSPNRPRQRQKKGTAPPTRRNQNKTPGPISGRDILEEKPKNHNLFLGGKKE